MLTFLIFIVAPLFEARADEAVQALDPKIIITQAEGYARLIAPVDPAKAVVGTRAMVEGKMVQVIEAAPGVEVPSGSVVQTFEGKVKMALPSGDAFIASRATEVEMNMEKVSKGKSDLNVELKRGLLRGVVQKSEELSVNVVTDKFKAKMGEAEFITGTLRNADPSAAAQGAVMKMVQGSAQLAPLTGLQGKLIEAKAGADVVFGLKSADLVPMLQEKAMMQATALNPEKLLAVPPELQESLALMNNTSAALESKLDQMIEPEDDCGCPSIEQRLKRQALKTAKSFAQNKQEKESAEAREPQSENADQKAAEEEAEESEDSQEGTLARLANSKDLACLSPVIEQLQGAAQIISSLKDGIFSSKEAKPGSCVSKNATFKSFIESRAKLKFPNGDELLSGDNVNMSLDWAKDQLNVNLNQGSIRGAFNEATGKVVNLKADGLNAVTKGGDLALSAKSTAQDAASSAATAGVAAAGSATSLASGLLSGVGGALSSAAGATAGAAAGAAAQAGAAGAAAQAGALAQAGAATAGAAAAGGAASAAGGAALAGAAGSAGAVLSVFDGTAKVGSKVVEAGSQIAAQSAKPVKIPEEQLQNLKAETEPLKKIAKAAKTPLRPSPSHPSPTLDGLDVSESQPEEALIRRYLDPTL